MTCCIDYIINSWHDRKVTIIINHSTVSCVVVSFESWKIFVNIKLVIIQNWLHKWWRKRLLDTNYSRLVWRALVTCFFIKYSNIESRNWFSCWSWFGLEFLIESTKVWKDRTSSFCLPISIINKLVGELFKKPLKCRNIASFTNTGYSFQTWQISLFDKFSMRIFFTNRSDCCWWCIQMINLKL